MMRVGQLAAFAAAGAIGAAAVLAAPHAHATPLSYLQALTVNGFYVTDTAAAITSGYQICGMLNHANGADVAEWVWENTPYTTTATPERAGMLVVIAVEQLCQQHDHRGQSVTA